eukprot:Nk52_evm17s257 gene=Nk52_evmTU17s257
MLSVTFCSPLTPAVDTPTLSRWKPDRMKLVIIHYKDTHENEAYVSPKETCLLPEAGDSVTCDLKTVTGTVENPISKVTFKRSRNWDTVDQTFKFEDGSTKAIKEISLWCDGQGDCTLKHGDHFNLPIFKTRFQPYS